MLRRAVDDRAQVGGRVRIFLVALAVACLTFGGGTPSAAAQAPVRDPHVIRFVAFGDSLTAGSHNPGMPWPVELDAMRADLTLVRNAGVGGNTTVDMLRRIDTDVFAYSPDLLFIFAGINDLSACESVEEIVANIDTMVGEAKAHGIGRVILLLNSHSVVMADGPSCVPTVQAKMDRLDEALMDYATEAGVETIDLRPALDTNGSFTPGYFVADGVHYNARGVDRVCAAIDSHLPIEAAWFTRLGGP